MNSKGIVFSVIGLLVVCVTWWKTAEEDEFVQTLTRTPPENTTVDSPNPIQLPDTIQVPIYASDLPREKEFKVRYGDTFHHILRKIQPKTEHHQQLIAGFGEHFNSRDFQVGQPYRVQYATNTQQPRRIIFPISPTTDVVVDLIAGEVIQVEKTVDYRNRQATIHIRESLAASVAAADLPEDLTDKIVSIMAWDVDFGQLTRQDRVDLHFEEAFVENERIGSGKILALRFEHVGTVHLAYAFDNGKGIEYFDPKGENMNRGPLQFELITSLYNRRRLHPVRRTYRSHLGMDFEAKIGTTVTALKSGMVEIARYGRANGNYVRIRHDKSLKTQYLHLSKIDSAIKVGQTVTSGQKIGEVGSTGLSSGPHLCLRVWYNGKQRDPLEFDFPRRAPVSEDQMAAFKEVISKYSDISQMSPS